MATAEEDYDSLASQAIAFLRACQPAFPPTVTPANVAQYLRSGVVLCHCLNALSPGCVPAPAVQVAAHWTNAVNFLNGCRAFGVPEDQLFEPDDLISEKNPLRVMQTIVALCRIVYSMAQSAEAQQQPQPEQATADDAVPPPPPPPTDEQDYASGAVPPESQAYAGGYGAVPPPPPPAEADQPNTPHPLYAGAMSPSTQDLVNELQALCFSTPAADAPATVPPVPSEESAVPAAPPMEQPPQRVEGEGNNGDSEYGPPAPADDQLAQYGETPAPAVVRASPPPVRRPGPSPGVPRKALPVPGAASPTPGRGVCHTGASLHPQRPAPPPPPAGARPAKSSAFTAASALVGSMLQQQQQQQQQHGGVALPGMGPMGPMKPLPSVAAPAPAAAEPEIDSPAASVPEALSPTVPPPQMQTQTQMQPQTQPHTEHAPVPSSSSFRSKFGRKKDKSLPPEPVQTAAAVQTTPAQTESPIPGMPNVSNSRAERPVAAPVREMLTTWSRKPQVFEAIKNTLMSLDDVVCVSRVFNELAPLAETSRGKSYQLQNAVFRSFKDVLLERVGLERQRASQLRQTERTTPLERCGIFLGVDKDIPKELFFFDGKLDPTCTNLVLKLEIRSLLYELAALMSVVGLGEDLDHMRTKNAMLEKQVALSDKERRAMKVQLDSALSLSAHGDCTSEEGMIFATDANGARVVKGGTVAKLVERLFSTVSDRTDEYAKVFLLTYRKFMDPNTLLEETIKKYGATSSGGSGDSATGATSSSSTGSLIDEQRRIMREKTRFRVCAFLKNWMENHYHDFEVVAGLLPRLLAFLQEHPEDPMLQGVQKKLQKTMEAAQSGAQRNFVFASEAPAPIVPAVATAQQLTLEAVSPVELARQLTLREHELLRAIEPHELLSCGWAKKDKEQRSPHLLAMIQHFNDVAAWVASVVLRESAVDARVRAVARILSLIEECQKLNNYFAVFELSGGLNCSAVNRLHRTWDEVARAKLAPQKVMAITQPTKNYTAYRDIVARASPPFIPYLGLYLSDLTFIEDGNPDTLAEGAYVNFEKCAMVARVIQDLCKHQLVPYNFRRVDIIAQWMDAWEAPSEKECFDLSLRVEPRGSQQ